MDCKIDDKTSKSESYQSLQDIQTLISELNTSLLELKKEKDEYETRINECRGLCHRIRELMDATTTRFIAESNAD